MCPGLVGVGPNRVKGVDVTPHNNRLESGEPRLWVGLRSAPISGLTARRVGSRDCAPTPGTFSGTF
jgi:hypothetical protein